MQQPMPAKAVTPQVGEGAFDAPAGGEPYLLTPGPLTTSAVVKGAMQVDWGSWDGDFRALTAELRARLLAMAGDDGHYECVPLQGSGTYVVEAMLGTLVPPDAHVLVLANGAYGKRAAQTLRYLDRRHSVIDMGDFLPPRAVDVERALDAGPDISHVLVVHCETSSGIRNPVEAIAEVVAQRGCKLLVDSMSAFGALPLDVRTLPVEAFVSSANKCIEGVPGFGFVVVRRDALARSEGVSHSLSLDLYAQWRTLEDTGQWRYTPPTHVVAAFIEALHEHEAQGGAPARLARYEANRDALVAEMRGLGFETLLDDRWLSPIIVTFFCPADPAFDFARFYGCMKASGFIVYPGKLTVVDSFRIGCIGHFGPDVMCAAAAAAATALAAMGVRSAAPPPEALAERVRLSAHAGSDATLFEAERCR